jgi:release factor glutamine methyltransferase
MKIPNNRIQSIIDYFHLQLDDLYPKEEVTFFAFWALSELMGFSRSDMILRKDERISESEILTFIRIVKRLKKYEPIQYILGATEFYGMRLKVNKNVLIPRPETEELVDWIKLSHSQNHELKILDIGTGSGCIPIALKKHLPKSKVSGIDVSESALELAKENASANQVEVDFSNIDIRNKEEWKPLGKFDIIVSNPPYVLDKEKSEMRKNVLDYEPELALFVEDDDPLIFYRYILDFTQSHLETDGEIYFELNENFGDDLKELCQQKGFGNCELKKDLSGKIRMLRCSK